jgi:dTDP-4-amino-4,6-dideoxygalactose transaminase
VIPFLDLKAQYESIATEVEPAVLEVLRSGGYVQGRRVAEFERNFAAFCGAEHAVAVNTGTSALHLALLAMGIGPGDEVITVPMTFVATVAAIRYVGATPVFVDINAATGTLDPSLLDGAITPRTKAIMPVHLHGRLADMQAIMTIARRHGVPVIEDAAQAHGACLAGSHAGTFGDIGCFSFYPGKNLGACGEGGAIVTNDPRLADEVRLQRDWGQTAKYHHERVGYNFRMDEVQGAVLDIKLRYLREWTEKRRQVAAYYDEHLSGVDVALPQKPAGFEHVYHVYAIRSRHRDRLHARLRDAGVATGMHYPRPVHLQPAYRDLAYEAGDFPVAEAFAVETLSLPIYPELTRIQLREVCDALRRAAGSVQDERSLVPETA